MKVYAHYGRSGDNTSDFTKVFKIADNAADTVEDLLQKFVQAYNKRQSDAQARGATRGLLSASLLRVMDGHMQPVLLTMRMVKAFDDLEDVYIEPKPLPVRTRATATAAAGQAAKGTQPTGIAASTGSKPASTPPATGDAKSNVTSTSGDGGPSDDADGQGQVYGMLLRLGEEAVKQRNYRRAVELYTQVITRNAGHTEGLRRLASVWLTAGRPERGVKWAKKALAGRTDDSSLYELLADCLSGANRSPEAVEHYKKALELQLQVTESQGETAKNMERQHALQLSLARCLYSIAGNPELQNTAASLVMSVLQQKEDDWEGLFQYGTIALDRGLVDDAVKVALRCLVQRPHNHQGIRTLFTRCIKAPGGYKSLMEQLHDGENRQAAFAFLATVIKEKCAIDEAIALYQEAVRLEPLHTSYVLNLAHCLELQHRSDEALQVIRAFCAVSPIELGGGVKLKELVPLMEGLPARGILTCTAWRDAESWQPTSTPGVAGKDAATTGAAAEAVDGVAEKLSEVHVHGDNGSAGAQTVKTEGDPSIQKIEYTSEQLDALAIVFTAVKLLFIGGALPCAARLVTVLSRAREASAKELHTTLIRNEAAYYGCAAQLLQDYPPPAHSVADGSQLKPLYVCGDSHCLSVAWREVTFRGERRTLFPALVTGCKVWHMRDESNFYPKMQFLNTMAALPRGAQVIFMFGEIDCREGLMLAVEKCKYETLEEGIEATLDIYEAVLLRLVKEHEFEIIVHPIAPVLDVTREIVKPFAAALARRMRKIIPAAKGRLHYLDFFDRLLTSDGTKLEAAYNFDGTHLSPTYMPLLCESLSACA